MTNYTTDPQLDTNVMKLKQTWYVGLLLNPSYPRHQFMVKIKFLHSRLIYIFFVYEKTIAMIELCIDFGSPQNVYFRNHIHIMNNVQYSK